MIYLDTSAFVKLVWEEPESAALQRFIGERAGTPVVSSSLLTVEARRAVQREDLSALPRVDLLLTRIGRVGMTFRLVESASRLPGGSLRSLDAIHLATVLALRDEIDVVVSYDQRLSAATEEHKLPVAAPGVRTE